MAAFLLILLVGVSCKDNDNWKIVTDPQPGVYIQGSATVFSSNASTALLKEIKLDGHDPISSMVGMYTWLKKDGTFTFAEANENGDIVQYGMGSVLESNDIMQRMSIVPDANPFSVTADGLYYVVVNTQLAQLSLFPVKWGMIGDATPGGWDAETPLSAVTYNVTGGYAEFDGTIQLKAGSYKFRYGGTWGYEIPDTDDSKVKIYTDITGGNKGDENFLTSGYTNLQNGGDNLVNSVAGSYKITLKYDVRTGLFSAKAELISAEG